ncbi:MAG TPA: hypothetical protein PKD64_11935 [Pirellulaceae bacterium]|nr:hypothetical protein [Pirellulaceae bacterium]HMO92895.1 hypothetical protein [Pirellulaceae bacterium]HMP69173.1 hypothetical protein [Pirellulaceae bacterium]
MLRTTIACLLILCLLQTGCRSVFSQRTKQPLPPVFAKDDLTLASVTGNINRNTDNVRQVEADVRISMNGLPSAITGTMLLETPDHLRLKAGVMGISDLGVDIGSNRELFWIWTKASLPGQPSNILYARHDQFAQSAAGQQMRFQPKWIIDALGLLDFKATEVHEGPFAGPNNRIKIHSLIDANGEPMMRHVLIHPQYGWIEQVAYYDKNGNRMAYANALEHRYDEKLNTVVPQFIQLYAFPTSGEKMELTIQIKRLKINELYVDPEQTWKMPQPRDVPAIDLSTVSF